MNEPNTAIRKWRRGLSLMVGNEIAMGIRVTSIQAGPNGTIFFCAEAAGGMLGFIDESVPRHEDAETVADGLNAPPHPSAAGTFVPDYERGEHETFDVPIGDVS